MDLKAKALNAADPIAAINYFQIMKQILVLCTGNSARSQMAHGYLQSFAGEGAWVYSAGVAPHGVNPLSVKVMMEDGIDISHHTSNHVDEYTGMAFDYVITVCDNAREQCPIFPSSAELIHQSFPDPGKSVDADGLETQQTGEEALTSFRHVRDLIKAYCKEFVLSRI
jgi:arsenate reductase